MGREEGEAESLLRENDGRIDPSQHLKGQKTIFNRSAVHV
jgi:hypothetical protein